MNVQAHERWTLPVVANGVALARQRQAPRPIRVRPPSRPGVPLAADGTPRLPYVGYDAHGYPYESPAVSQNDKHHVEAGYAAYALRSWLPTHYPVACIAADMHLYWDPNQSSVGPDIMIALGVDQGDRSSFKTWEERVPDLVMEVLSPSTAKVDLGRKRDLYQSLGVRECWFVDLRGRRLPDGIVGDRRLGRNRYGPIRPLAGTRRFPSRVVPLDFRVENGRLSIRDTETGEDLPRYEEAIAGRQQAERQRDEERIARLAAERENERLRGLLRNAGLANGSV